MDRDAKLQLARKKLSKFQKRKKEAPVAAPSAGAETGGNGVTSEPPLDLTTSSTIPKIPEGIDAQKKQGPSSPLDEKPLVNGATKNAPSGDEYSTSFMDLYQTPEPPHRTGTATPSIDNCDTISQSGDSTWLEGWVSKVTNLMSSRKGSPSVHFDKLPGADSSYGDSPKKGDGEARRPSVVQPVLKRLGLSSEVLAFIASLESDEEEQNQLQDEYQESPTAAQLRELEIYIPKISSLEPTEGSTKDSLLKAWETKAKVLQDALSRSKSTIQKEITGRKALENQVATITSRIALALEKMADEKAGAMKEMKNMHALLEKGFKEKAILQGQVVELSRAKREGYAASPRGAVDTSSLQAKVEQLTIDLEKSRLESSLLREECEVLRNAAKNDLSEKEKNLATLMAAFETEKSAFESIKQKHEDEMTLLSDMDADLTAQKEAFAKEKADLEQERGAVDRATEKLLAAREAIARDQANLAQREAQLASSALPEFSAKEEWSKIEAAKKQIESERDVLAQDRIAIKQRELKLQESVGGHAKLKAVMDMDDLRASLERRHKEASKKLSDLNAREKALVQAEKDFEMYRQTATSATQPGSPTKFGQHMSTMIAQMQDEYQIRQKELDDAMEAFGAFKAKVEESLKQKEARLTEASQKLELDKRNLVEKHVAEKKEWEKKERDQTRLIERLKAVQLGDPDSIALSQEFIELETEKASVVALKLRLEDEADQMDKEKDKVEKEAAQLEHEWAVVKLKEAEVAKALADISVAAAQQAVGSSISTAETMLSRDRIRELEGQCKELSMENEELKSWTGSKQTLRKSRSLMGVAVNPLPGAAVVGKANETVPKTQEPNGASSDVLQAIADLTRTNKEMKSQIDYLVEQRAAVASTAQKTPEPIRRANADTVKPERTLRKPRKRIADPRQIQSALGTWATEDRSHDGAPMLLSTFSSPAKKDLLPQPPRSWMGSPINNGRSDSTPVPPMSGHHLRNPLLSRPASVAPLDTTKTKSGKTADDIVNNIDAQVSARLSAALETLDDDELSHFSDTTRRILLAKKGRDTSQSHSRREQGSSQSMYSNNTRHFSRASNATTATASNTDKIRDMVRRRLDEKRGTSTSLRRRPS